MSDAKEMIWRFHSNGNARSGVQEMLGLQPKNEGEKVRLESNAEFRCQGGFRDGNLNRGVGRKEKSGRVRVELQSEGRL